ncbi:FORKHEAD protein [Rhizoctonia solani]|uniref:FORKHEAD protein n=1 Tax=Rhizoctonia solani TaxID=456999 RepID=A0A8H7IB31_9AGAM|nr:FORKHEAD protein [Rhizoctonia solani]
MDRMNSQSIPQDGTSNIRVIPELSPGRLLSCTDVDNSSDPRRLCEDIHDTGVVRHTHRNARPSEASQLGIDPELTGLDALEDARPGERPAYPFTTLIRYAIKGSPNGRLLLEDIYSAIQTRYPYFEKAPSGWKALSLLSVSELEPGKGSYWIVNDSMPHAKPSRVRVRKRKARPNDDNIFPGTPRTVPDTFQSEFPDTESSGDSENRRGSIVYGHTGSPGCRLPSYVEGNMYDRLSNYSHDMVRFRVPVTTMEANLVARRIIRTQPMKAGNWNPNTVTYITQAIINHPMGHSKLRNITSPPLLRDVIGTRDDIDNEWCRSMVDRLKDTGLL